MNIEESVTFSNDRGEIYTLAGMRSSLEAGKQTGELDTETLYDVCMILINTVRALVEDRTSDNYRITKR